MKIAVLSKADARGGGASRIASELVDQLLAAGQETVHWTARQYGPSAHPLRPLYGDIPTVNFAVRAGHSLLRALGVPEGLAVEQINPDLVDLLDCDVIHVHDISNALAVDTLAWLARFRPLVWTLHDCSPFTGGCLYPMACLRFRARCGHCPGRGIWPLVGLFDGTPWILAQKRRFARQTRFVALAPSRWMADMAENSGFFPRPIVVSNGIDLGTFRPVPKDDARRRLGLPSGRLVLAVCSGDLFDTRKGIRQALAVARCAHVRAPLVLAIGTPSPAIVAEFPDIDIHFTGFINDRNMLAVYYAAADLLLYCSYADNQPLTVMEAMACGTPVVGFAAGGIPELVDHLENGFLSLADDGRILRAEIEGIIGSADRLRAWSMAAAHKAARLFGWERCVSAHLHLYESLVEGGKSH